MTVVVRGELSKLHRKIIAALITIDVHARDIVEELHVVRPHSARHCSPRHPTRFEPSLLESHGIL